MIMRSRVGYAGVIATLLIGQLTWADDPVAVLSEIRVSQGEVWVQHIGTSDWLLPRPLLALEAGDQIRTAGGGQAVLCFIGGSTQTVSAANSPFTVQAPSPQSGKESVGVVVSRITQFLIGQGKSPTYRPLAVRKPLQPVILAPRETKLLPGPVTFEWSGSDRLRYSIRVRSPQGVLWEQMRLPRQSLTYPDTAPSLGADVIYTWELQTKGYPLQRAQFEILPAVEAARIQAALAQLHSNALIGYPPNTVALLRAGLLFREGLYQGARQELLTALQNDQGEPSLHLLLGHLYDKIGLKEAAGEAFEKARSLSTANP